MTALEIAKQFEGRADDAGKLARAVIAESALSQSERKITRDAPVAPGMMSEAENRSGRADREQTASSGKPEQFVCRCAGEEGLLCLKWCGDKACKDAPQQVEGTASAPAYQSATPAGALPSARGEPVLKSEWEQAQAAIRWLVAEDWPADYAHWPDEHKDAILRATDSGGA